MTLEEKVAQLLSVPVEALVEGKRLSREKAGELLKHGIGEVTRVSGSRLGLKPREAARLVNEIQRFLVEETRLGIPAIIHEESLSGLMAPTATNFPQSIGLASTWDPELVYRVASEIRRQALLVGARQCLAPVLDVCRDPRWGRTEETYGEDPYLVAAMGVAYVRGLQSDDLSRGVIATPKHFAAHGFPEGGRNIAQVHVGVRELREVFLYPFEAAVKEGGALSVMAAYHEIDGVPCHTNYWLLTEVLRGEWGFRGFVVSDYFAIRQLITVHRVAGDELEAAIQALEAGVDVELPGADCYKRLMNAVREGVISERAVEEAAAKVLRAKYLLGLFENPYVDEAAVPESLDSREARELALEAARKSIVLLKNDGVLPLNRDKLRAIAVIGPNAAEGRALLGDYTYTAHLALEELAVEAVSILEG
ncbi:MAG: beta-glucosidase, partial [Thermoprotei archaeon]